MDFRREGSEEVRDFGWGQEGGGVGLQVTDWEDVRAGIGQGTDLQSKLRGRCLLFNPTLTKWPRETPCGFYALSQDFL